MKKTRKSVRNNQQALLVAIVKSKGSGAVVAKELGCSQQSVSAWAKGLWMPRESMQRKLEKRYGIPRPWVLQ